MFDKFNIPIPAFIHDGLLALFGLKPGWHRQMDLAKNNYKLAKTYADEGNISEALRRLKLLLWFDPKHEAALTLQKELIKRQQRIIMPIEIAAEMEAKTLHEVHKACFPVYWKEAEISDMLVTSGTKAWVVRQDSKAVAMLMTRTQFEQAEILTIAVVPDARRALIAQRLLEHAHETLYQDGVRKIFLEVAENNEAAAVLYKRLGYVETSRRKGYYRQADSSLVDALVMSKELH